jgi:hypothetical protein
MTNLVKCRKVLACTFKMQSNLVIFAKKSLETLFKKECFQARARESVLLDYYICNEKIFLFKTNFPIFIDYLVFFIFTVNSNYSSFEQLSFNRSDANNPILALVSSETYLSLELH